MPPAIVWFDGDDFVVPEKWNCHILLVSVHAFKASVQGLSASEVFHNVIRRITWSAFPVSAEAKIATLERCNADFGVCIKIKVDSDFDHIYVVLDVTLLLDDLGSILVRMA